jgi:hypothetical protein
MGKKKHRKHTVEVIPNAHLAHISKNDNTLQRVFPRIRRSFEAILVPPNNLTSK